MSRSSCYLRSIQLWKHHQRQHSMRRGIRILRSLRRIHLYLLSGHDAFDIGHTAPDPTPTKYELGYLNQAWAQSALGVPLNVTFQNMVVYNGTSSTFLFQSLIQAVISVAYRDIISCTI
ncbi:hypothetical protein BDZ45DRAFT_15697 [Acephala macrosclerotiorum]|nr:hypothetical protein BDZ45DRAFT_15697 [Acephala macrosclerotiorum]